MYSAKLVGNQMDTVFGLYLPEYEIPAPKAKTNYKEVPYRDGAIDKTAPDGVVTFEDREWSLVFQKTGEDVSAYDVPALSASLMNAIHGKSGEIIFDDDPNYKWVGRVFVENVQCENNGLIIANISLITQPYKYGIEDIVVTDTIETEVDEYQGSIVSFEYGLGKELTKLLANIEPIQDLHGYSHPWPAGGGKNRLPDIKIQDGTTRVTLGQEETYTSPQITLTAGDYTISVENVGANTFYVYSRHSGANTNYGTVASGESRSFTFTAEDGTYSFYVYRGGGVTPSDIGKFQLETGSTASAWTPYANVCPISGLTGLSVYRTGKNIFDISRFATNYPNYCSYADGVLSITTANTVLYSTGVAAKIPANSIITFSMENGTATNSRVRFAFADGTAADVYATNTPYTAPKDISAVKLNWSQSGTFTLSNFQAEIGSTATTYEPYNGNTYAVDWLTQAGMVYGGTLDVFTGVLTVDKASIDLGSINWTYESGYTYPYYIGTMPNDCVVGSTVQGQISVLCSIYESIQNIGASAFRSEAHNNQCCLNSNVSTRRLLVQNLAYTDAATFKTAMAGVQLVYDLETPLTYQLTPRQIAMLFGINNVWSDAGDVDVIISTFDVVTLSNGRKPQSPKISVTSEGEVALMFFVKGTKHIINLTAGEWSVPDLMLFEGDTDVYESGEGTVIYTYKEASL